MKHLKFLLITFIIFIGLSFSNIIFAEGYNKPVAPSGLNIQIINAVNNILDTVYNKKDNKSKYPTNESYIAYLDKVIVSLSNLKNTFTSTDTKYLIITYLSDGLINIKNYVQNQSDFINSISSIIDDDSVIISTGTTTTISNTITSTTNSSTGLLNTGNTCLFKTNEIIGLEKYIDKNNFILESGKEISAKFYLLNGDYKKLTVKCFNGIKTINTIINPIYGCKTGYTINNGVCENNFTNTNTNTGNCSHNGVNTYISGDVRCDGNKQIRCSNGVFQQISECQTDKQCYEKPERTTNGNFFTTCKNKFERFNTDSSMLNLSINEEEILTLKQNAQYLCSFNLNTGKYGNCIFETCLISSHDEGGSCISNTRKCDIPNTKNGGKQTWNQSGGWGNCQFIDGYTQCNNGYKSINQVCVTSYEACNPPIIGVNGKSVNLIQANGVEYSNKTPTEAGSVWNYDSALSNACTYKCKDGYKKTSDISGYRGYEICIKKNICESQEYYNSNWISSQNSNMACLSCKGDMPYGGAYTSSTLRPSERSSGENDTWKYVDSTLKLSESCTWTCKTGLVPGKIKNTNTVLGPLTCCNPSDSTCIQQ